MANAQSSSKDIEDGEGGNRIFESAKRLADSGVVKVPNSYIFPPADRPRVKEMYDDKYHHVDVVDLLDLEGDVNRRSQALQTIGRACSDCSFFQVVNHGIPAPLLSDVMSVTSLFFNLPNEDKLKYMSDDFTKPVRYGTSFNQVKDEVFCWRDFVKLNCHPLSKMIHLWPSHPPQYRQIVGSYAKQVRILAGKLIMAIIETLSLPPQYRKEEFEDGSQVMVLNYYPSCPEPELTLGIPPHSDYGCISILLQDEVGGLQVQQQGQWKPVKPLPGSFVVIIGDHLEILSNGRYKSAMHRVVVNSETSRISIATLHSLPFEAKISPALELIDEEHPQMFNDTDFSSFLKSMATKDLKAKTFLESIRLFKT